MAETAFQAQYRRKKKAKVQSSAMTTVTPKGKVKPKGYLWAGFEPRPRRSV